MALPEPEQINWILKYTAGIITAIILLLTAVLKLYKHTKEKAVVAEAVLKEKPVSQAQLTRLELQMTNLINAGFEKMTTLLRTENRILHNRINSELTRRKSDV